MLVNRYAQLDKVTSRDKTRPLLGHVNIRELPDGTQQAEATDSYMLAIVPVRLEDTDTAGLVSTEAWAKARKHDRVTIADNAAYPDGSTLPRADSAYIGATFPDCPSLIPDYAPDDVICTIGLSAELLHKLALGLGGTTGRGAGVKLTIKAPNRPILVESLSGNVPGAKGLLMPVRLS